MSKEQEAMEAVREIEKGKGTPNDPPQPKGTPPPAAPEKEKAKAAQVPPAEKPEKKQEDPVEALRRENEELRRKQEDSQRRLDAIERQKAQVPPAPVKDNPLAQYSEDELISYKIQHPEYAVQIEKELHRRTKESAEKTVLSRYELDKNKSAYDQAAYQAWPDLRNPSSEHARLTAQIFNADPAYSQHPQGFYVAAQAARTQLVEKELSDLRSQGSLDAEEQKRLQLESEREKKRNGLNTGNRAADPPASDDETFENSFSDLTSARPGSSELLQHMRNLEKRRNKAS